MRRVDYQIFSLATRTRFVTRIVMPGGVLRELHQLAAYQSVGRTRAAGHNHRPQRESDGQWLRRQRPAGKSDRSGRSQPVVYIRVAETDRKLGLGKDTTNGGSLLENVQRIPQMAGLAFLPPKRRRTFHSVGHQLIPSLFDPLVDRLDVDEYTNKRWATYYRASFSCCAYQVFPNLAYDRMADVGGYWPLLPDSSPR